MMLKGCTLGILGLLLVPVYLAFVTLYLLAWFILNITGIGPLAQFLCSRRDRRLLESTIKHTSSSSSSSSPSTPTATPNNNTDAVIEMLPVPINSSMEAAIPDNTPTPPPPRRLAVRWSPGHGDPSLPPICIPNGLGATLFTIGSLHDLLEDKGYPVLSYDRAGVGLSDPVPKGQAYTVDLLIADLKFVLDHYTPKEHTQWILCGPSMGSIVCQVFLAKYPGQVLGFLNMDGLPYPFVSKRDKFLAAGKVYCLTSCLTYTGILRPVLALSGGMLAPLASKHFPVAVIQAQMNESNFYSSLHREMTTMMDLCAEGQKAWGPAFDIAALNPTERLALINAAPTACGDALDAVTDGGRWVDLPRAAVERGEDWTPVEETKGVLRRLLARAAQQHFGSNANSDNGGGNGAAGVNESVQGEDDVETGGGGGGGGGAADDHTAPLWITFQNLIIRVMSARNYNFGPASGFYDAQMQGFSAAEHSLHAHLAVDGKRLVFPTRSHDKMFFGLVGLIAEQLDEITIRNAERKGLPIPTNLALTATAAKAASKAVVVPTTTTTPSTREAGEENQMV